MTRRGASLAVSGVLALGLAIGAATMEVPYVGLGPGPACDTLSRCPFSDSDVIKITGTKTYPTTGKLDLTTVQVYTGMHLGDALQYWFDEEFAVVPREVVFPPNEEDPEEQTRQEMTRSQADATTAALRQLKVPLHTEVVVESVVDGSPAARILKAEDLITAIDGKPVRRRTDVTTLLGKHKPGETATVTFKRAGKSTTATLKTVPSTDGQKRATIGVALIEESRPSFSVTLRVEDVGGPSAGLMLALGIIDKLTPGSLTGGLHIAGTGTIDGDGNVGPIGGIHQKLIGARSDGATVFLTPAGNYDEAVAAHVDGLELVKVATLAESVGKLTAIAASH